MSAILDNAEKLVRVFDVPTVVSWLPTRRTGKTLTVQTVYNWARVGVKKIKLETVDCGSVMCTSEPALRRFFERISTPGATQESRTASDASKAHQRAKARLAAIGI